MSYAAGPSPSAAPSAPAAGARRRIGVGLVGFGWLGQAHARSFARIRTLVPDRPFEPRMVACSDTDPGRLEEAIGAFGFDHGDTDWRAVVDDPRVDVVVVAAPNMVHLEVIEAAAEAGKHVFCEKPVGGTPEQTTRAARAVREAGVISGVGFNYRWAPLVQYVRTCIAAGDLGRITNYRGRFFAMYGADPLGTLSWRYRLDQAGHGASSDLLSHAVDLAHMLAGPITRVVGTTATVISERPLPSAAGTHFSRGAAGDPTGAVTNEDYAGMLCEFASGALGSFEAGRAIVGPEGQMAFDVYGTEGAAAWTFERLNELQLFRGGDGLASGYTTVLGGDRFPHHGLFAPGNANGIGYEDLVTIEDLEFCRAVAEERPFAPGFEDALAWAQVQAALLRSVQSGRWEPVEPSEDA